MIMIIKFIFNFNSFCVIVCFFLTKLLTIGILFSTVINAVFVAKLLTSEFFFYLNDFSIIIRFFNKTASIMNFIFKF